MKRYGNLYEKICSMDNLYLAFQHAKKGKGWYKEVQQIEKRPYYYLAGLQWMLQNHLYKTSEYATFTKKDGKKEREIYKLPFFPDRIAQWAVLQVIEPQLLAYFTDDTYSAIPNKGIHAAYKKLRLAVDTVPEEMTYCLKIDCKKFYPSIDHETLKQKFRRKYKDPELLELIDEVIDSISTCPATDENIEFYRSCGNEIKIVKVNGKDFIEGVGIPIGNYFSQYDGNFFLSGFDHWIKEVKRVKHYYRYMDDIYVTYDRERGSYLSNMKEVMASAREILIAKITEEDIISGSLANTNSYLKKIASKLTDYDGEDKDPFHELDFDKTKSV